MWGAARQIAPDLSFKRWERKKKKITISSLINLPNQKVVVFFYLLRVPLFSGSVLASSKWTVHSSVCCETMRSATLAFIHTESHTQSCFLTHTCRGYERGYQYLQVNTFSSNTDISLCLAPPHSASVSLPCKPSENIGGSLYWLRRLGFSPRRLKCHRLPDVSLKSPVPPLAVAPGYYYPPLKEWQSGPKRRDTNLCGWSCSAASSQCSRPIR